MKMKHSIVWIPGIMLMLIFSGCRAPYYEPKQLPQYPELNDKDFAKAPCYAISPSHLVPDQSAKEFLYDPDKPALIDVLLKEAMEKRGYHTEDFSKCISLSHLDKLEHVIEVLNTEYATLPLKKGIAVIYRMVVMIRSKGDPNKTNHLAIQHARFFQVYSRKDYATINEIPEYFSKKALQPLFVNLMNTRGFREALQPGGMAAGKPLYISPKLAEVTVIPLGGKKLSRTQDIPDAVFPPKTDFPTDAELERRLIGRWRCENYLKRTTIRNGQSRQNSVFHGMEEFLFRNDGNFSRVQCFFMEGNNQPNSIISSGRWAVRSGSLYLAFFFGEKIMVLKMIPHLQKDKIETLNFDMDIAHYQEQFLKVAGKKVHAQQKKRIFTVSSVYNGGSSVEFISVDHYKKIVPKEAKKK